MRRVLNYTEYFSDVCYVKPHSARTGTVFSQRSATVVHHKANDDGVVYAILVWFKYDTALSAVI